MGAPAWKAGFGLARAASAVAEPAAPIIFPLCQEAVIVENPNTIERTPNFSPDADQLYGHGFDLSWSASGITCDLNTLGYMLWLVLGADAFAATRHTITPNDDGQYCNVFMDQQIDIDPGAGTSIVKRLIGARLTKLRVEQMLKDFAKVSIEGVATNYGTPLASIAPTVPTGATNDPLAWKHFQDAAGFFKLGLNGGATAADTTITGFAFEIARNNFPNGPDLGSNQPSDFHLGQRTVTFEFQKEWFGANASAQYAAFRSHQYFELDAKAIISTNDFEVQIPSGLVMESPIGSIGRKDETIKAKFKARARKTALAVITAIIKDGSIGAYT